MTAPLAVLDLGRRAYRPTLALQRGLVERRRLGALDHDVLILVEHESVVTLGRGTRESSLPQGPESLARRGVEVVEVERGGDVTWHGPGQLVGYPILDLTRHRQDLHWYLRQLEELLIVSLAPLGLAGMRQPGLTGVWTGGRKVASIGVHVRQWITFHGFALNVHPDLRAFDQIVACGIQGVDMTSVERELVLGGKSAGTGRERLWQQVRGQVIEAAGQVFERQIVTENPAVSESVAVEP